MPLFKSALACAAGLTLLGASAAAQPAAPPMANPNFAAVQPGAFNKEGLDGCRTDGLVPPKTHWATRIDNPPYYAYPLSPGITFTYLGVKVDSQARMQSAAGASANMFAAGEIMAGNVLGKGYVAGIGMTIGGVFGRLAGQEAAAHVAG